MVADKKISGKEYMKLVRSGEIRHPADNKEEMDEITSTMTRDEYLSREFIESGRSTERGAREREPWVR